MKQRDANGNDEDWEYGDVWKKPVPEEATAGNSIEYVELLRVDGGMGYDDSALLELVTYLGSRGVRATYDSFSIGLEPAAIKTYVLKVEAGREEDARRYLAEKG